MRHLTLPEFWVSYGRLPQEVQRLADKNYELLEIDPRHPSLRLKKVRGKPLWSVRVGKSYRALAYDAPGHAIWFWIGTHAEYDARLA